MEFMK